MTPEEEMLAMKAALKAQSDVLRAFAEHNNELRRALRASRYYQLTLVAFLLASGLLKVCQ